MALRLIFIGPPGGGKGTQGKRLAARGFLHVSSGDMLRAEVESGGPRAAELAALLRSGALVPDEWLFAVVGDYLRAHRREAVILDGYPRTLAQARHLGGGTSIDAAVFFEISDEVILRRLGDRVIGADGAIYDLREYPPPEGVVWSRRVDDDPEVTRKRLALFRGEEAELRDFYRGAGLYRGIAAERPADEVSAQINSLVDELQSAALSAEPAS